MTPAKVLYLIDGSSQMYRAYHAIRQLTGPDGRSTNAVYGFVTMLRKLMTDHRPEYIAAAFDVAGRTFRTELSADYKANRAPMPDDLAEQVPQVHEACRALGVPVLTYEGYEADDVIGTLACQAAAAGFDVAIVTGDKDFFQLVGEHVRVFNPRDEGAWFDADGVKEKFGVSPGQVVDVLALMGDAIDNVKGVPGIGEKGARELIAAHGSLDALLDAAADLPQKRYRNALIEHADAARQSRELVRIHTDLALPFEAERLRFGGASREACFDLFSRLGFRSLLADYAPTAATVAKRYVVMTARDQIEAVVAAIRTAGRLALHTLGDTEDPLRGHLVGIAVACEPRSAWYLPLGHQTLDGTTQLPLEAALEVLRPVLEDVQLSKIGHDLKDDALRLSRHGIDLRGLRSDTLLASYLLEATRSTHRLEDLTLERLGYRAVEAETLRGKGAKAESFARVPIESTVDYACERADLPLQLAPDLEAALERDALAGLYRTLEIPLVPVLVEMERAGVRVDVNVLREQSRRVDRELAARERRIYDLAGTEFNIASPRQLADVLFDKLQLPTLKRTGKTRSASTAVEVLEELAGLHELPREILEWRGLQKLKGTYLDALPALVNPETGRVHTHFNQAVAATGRLSSSDPNLQNIPIRTEIGREIRRAFVADPGWLLISADYSQIELRVLAHLSEDEALVSAFQRGEDIHDRTAERVFGSDSALDAYELRRRAKIINYALLYGKTAFTLARDIGVPQPAAQAFIDAYFEGFPAVRRFIDRTIAEARETGVVTTLFGRRRAVAEITSRNGQIRAAAERIAVNLPVQGTAADILKRAMLDVHAALAADSTEDTRPRMILTVHDELLIEAPEGRADAAAATVRTCMERAVALRVPLQVDVGIGRTWKDAK